MARRGNTMAEQFPSVVGQRDHFNFGATQVDTNAHDFSPQCTTTLLQPNVTGFRDHPINAECDGDGNFRIRTAPAAAY
ncbi:hypothetical protein D3C76_1380900 [compost metagenome]